jgi:hypothetical protein
VGVETERAVDDYYRLHVVGAADAHRSTVRVEIEDVELGSSSTEYFSKAIQVGLTGPPEPWTRTFVANA